MKFRFETISALVALTALSGCTADENTSLNDTDRVAVQISGGVQTRAANNQWDESDAIGVTMFKKGSAELAEGNYSNCKYQTPQGVMGVFTPATEKETIYFPKDGSEVDFMAYYPYSTEMKADYKMPLVVAEQTSQSKLDFMTSEHMEGTSKETPDVKLRFYHRLSKVIIRLKTDGNEKPERLIGSQLTIKGMLTKGTYDLLGGTLATDPESTAAIPVPTDAATGAKAEGIVLPRPAASGVTFDVVLTDGARYTAHMSDALALESGYKYTFNITLKKTQMTVTADIQDWIDNGEVEEKAHSIEVGTGETDDYFVTGDVMDLFVSSNLTSNQLVGSYTYTKEKQLWSNAHPYFWEDVDGTGTVTFRAKHTEATAPEGSYQLPDVLLAELTGVQRYAPIELPFVHAASQLIVKLVSPEGHYTSQELEKATILLPGFLTGATFENAIYVAGTERADIRLSKQSGEPTWKGCIQPQVIPVATKYIRVSLNNREYNVSTEATKTQEFVAGKKLTIIITLKKTELGAISATVTDWGLLPDINVDTDIDQ